MSNQSSLLQAPKLMVSLVLMVPFLATAQNAQSQDESQNDRMHALRIAYFVEELTLTQEESILFWPAWNEEEEKLKAHGDAIRAVEAKLKSTKSDTKAEELIHELKQLHLKGVELRHEAIDRIATIIGYRRAGMIEQVERELRTRVMKRRMKGSEKGDGQRSGSPHHH